MFKVSVVYFSGSGHTTKMAEAVFTGTKSIKGCEPTLIELQSSNIVNGRWAN